MKNKKGIVLPAVVLFQVAFAVVALAAVYHIPSWEQAKKNHTEAAYQAQQMWPQQWFAKLPGGDQYVK